MMMIEAVHATQQRICCINALKLQCKNHNKLEQIMYYSCNVNENIRPYFNIHLPALLAGPTGVCGPTIFAPRFSDLINSARAQRKVSFFIS